jgi:co-chaperonin GroES (HSP10)
MRARPGYCFVTADAELTASKFGVIYGSKAKEKPKTGLVVHHNTTFTWYAQGEDCLEGKKVVFDRWSGKPFTVTYKGEQHEFLSVSQWAILAVIENEEKETVQ